MGCIGVRLPDFETQLHRVYSLGQFLNLPVLHSHLLIHDENNKGALSHGVVLKQFISHNRLRTVLVTS